MYRVRPMRHRAAASKGSQSRAVLAAVWGAAAALLLVVVWAYPTTPAPVTTVTSEKLTIKATLSETTSNGQWTQLSATAEHSSSSSTSSGGSRADVVVAAAAGAGSGSGDGASSGSSSIVDTAAAGAVTIELSDTEPSDWQVPTKAKPGDAADKQQTNAGAVGAAAASAAASSAQQQQPSEPHFTSVGKIYASPASNGQPIKYYYKLQNVKLTRDALYFYHGAGFQRPKDVWVDFVSGNLTHPQLPNMIVIKGEVKQKLWYHLPVKYLNVANNEAKCNGWIEKPVYLLQARYSYNIWHTWNEGLMGAFQTLREQGYLPLVQVDGEGNMREVTEGMGPRCPLVWDPALNASRPETPEEGCVPKSGVVSTATCDTKNQAWCREGVASYHRFDGPTILPYTAKSVMNKWSQIYAAMTDDVKDWSVIDGFCFRNLIVGKTSTLNFYQPVNATETDSHRRERVEAMSVFKRFVTTAQRDFVRGERMGNPLSKAGKRYKGYKDKQAEELRKGIGPENISAAAWVQPKELPIPLLPQELGEIQGLLAQTGLPLPRHEMLLIPRNGAARRRLRQPARSARRHLLEQQEGGEGATVTLATETDGGDAADAVPDADAHEEVEEHEEAQLGEEAAEQQPQPGTAAKGATAAAGGHEDREDAEEASSDPGPERPQQAEEGADAAEEHPIADAASATAADAAAQQQQQVAQGQPQGEEEDHEPLPADEAEEAAKLAEDREAALERMAPLLPLAEGKFQLEQPRPVVAYMSRNFFSRGVLNEQDILEYILSRYNVTLRVTTLEEPLLEVMNLLARTDVLIGMHGAGWTNGIFIKHGATCLQMFPYGWRLPDGSTIRGHNYREIVLASETPYVEWVNPHWRHAFFRRQDFQKRWKTPYMFHPDPHGPHPTDGWPGNFWVYQNTYVDMASFGPKIDEAMGLAGIKPMVNRVQLPRPVAPRRA